MKRNYCRVYYKPLKFLSEQTLLSAKDRSFQLFDNVLNILPEKYFRLDLNEFNFSVN